MSAPERSPLLPRVEQPLRYAETLLKQFVCLSGLSSADALAIALVRAAATLAGSELSQLYLLDGGHTRLDLKAEWCDGAPRQCRTSLASDYRDQQLLQHCLWQNHRLDLPRLDANIHDSSFLPATALPWRSLLCLPLHDEQMGVCGLLLVASRHPRELDVFADSLTSLGDFALGRYRLLARLYAPNPGAPSNEAQPERHGLIGNSLAMRRIHRLLNKVLHNSVSVLLTGETGTGKEVVARVIHDRGSRRTRAFVVQNCASLPEALLESELFGYRRGAFSGADRDHKGLFDSADGGTLFLDEIGDMPLALQAKLLRVLQEGEVRPLGSTETHRVDVRIIAATHRNLREEVENGRFREDLFYRLSHFPIELPPLRERDEDILLLARHFAEKACLFLQRPPCRWADNTLEHLAGYAFPGNVRELKGLVERAVLLCDDHELLPEHFELQPQALRDTGMTLRQRLERVERNLLLDCLRKNAGNQSQAARELGLPRRTLLYRMDRLNIAPADI